MRELAPQGILGNQIITRREFLTLAGISFIALQTDLNGISLFSPEITVQRLDYEKEVNNPFLARVIIDIGNFFVPDRPFMYSHRAGNSIEGINTAYRKGANLFDIDANDGRRWKLYDGLRWMEQYDGWLGNFWLADNALVLGASYTWRYCPYPLFSSFGTRKRR